MRLPKWIFWILIVVCLVLMIFFGYSKGTLDWAHKFEITAEFGFNICANIILALLISYISFESGEKAERERIKTEKAETNNIRKIVHSIVEGKEKVVFSTKCEQQISSLPQKQQIKIMR
ncbi:TPA: hypothetical protein JBA93_15035, partial [Legionella pneumophila subsp. pneumophila]|nr:hypothetical protein [Legionella pneumophila subsp. pneumophila]